MTGRAKLYESDNDRRREREFFAAIERRFRCQCHKLHISNQLDFLGSRNGEGVVWGETKHRTHGHKDHPTVILSRHKTHHGIKLSKLTGLPFIAFWRFTDGDYYWRAPGSIYHYREERWSAANHNHDPLDIEFVIHIPIEELHGF